jgi:seryl-tRNA synthetase
MAEVTSLKDKMAELEESERELSDQLNNLLSSLPNQLQEPVPDGADEDDNVEIKLFKDRQVADENHPDHVTIGEQLDMMDFETAAKVAGARFVVLKGGLARLERALAQFMLDTHTTEHGYTEIQPPLLVTSDVMYGTTQLPKFEEDQYEILTDVNEALHKSELLEENLNSHASVLSKYQQLHGKAIEALESLLENNLKKDWVAESIQLSKSLTSSLFSDRDNLLEKYSTIKQKCSSIRELGSQRKWLIPTAEVVLTNLVREEILENFSEPLRFTAYTPCFRKEAGSAGRDTRGMIRQHQFYKVEMVSITRPEDSKNEHERMTQCAQTILEKLDLPYRKVILCSGDTGFAATKTYDLEVWLPGQGKYREISSCSNCGDIQSRRMNARYRPDGEKKIEFVHTLNGSGVAVGRALIAVIENYWDADSQSIIVPDVLKPYMGGVNRISTS